MLDQRKPEQLLPADQSRKAGLCLLFQTGHALNNSNDLEKGKRKGKSNHGCLVVFSTFIHGNTGNVSKLNISATLKVFAVNVICGCCSLLCDRFFFTMCKRLHFQLHSWASQPCYIQLEGPALGSQQSHEM